MNKNTKTNYLELSIIILLGVLTIVIIREQFKKLEAFTSVESNPITITNEMYKQLLTLKALDEQKVSNQANLYLPHFDVINSYKQSSQKFLNNLKTQVNTDLENKQEYLSRLDNTLLRLSQFKNDEYFKQLKNTDFKTIKSHNNGLNLSINRVGFDIYQVRVNDGCLAVTPENDYYIAKPNINDKSQHFRLIHIFNETEYRKNMSKAFPQLAELGSVHYPFTLVKSIKTDNCLKNSHGRLSIEPCREYEGQRWASSKTEHKCPKLF